MDLLQLKIYNIEPNFSYLQVCLKTHRVLDLHWKLSVIKVEKTLHETGSVLILIKDYRISLGVRHMQVIYSVFWLNCA